MRKSRVAAVLALSVLATGLSLAGPVTHANAKITASGVGNYCSVTWGTNAGYAFSWDKNGGDPCKTAQAGAAPGGVVRRAGLFSAAGTNNVVVRCNGNQSWVGLYIGLGTGPLAAAFKSANDNHQAGCVFTVAPKALPIFNSPFPLTADYDMVTGFDFARPPYNTLKPSDYGQTGTTERIGMNYKGKPKTMSTCDGCSGYGNNHDALDVLMPRGTKIKAAAEGKVVMARDYDSPCVGTSDSQYQKEVAIEHTVYGVNNYYEKFVTYYAHLKSYSVAVGDTVTVGQQIGLSGDTGCSSDPHLHFAVFRTTNTAQNRTETLQWLLKTDTPEHNSGRAYEIDPYGFAAPKGFDPWAWKAYPQGALSIKLWKSGQAPDYGDWGA